MLAEANMLEKQAAGICVLVHMALHGWRYPQTLSYYFHALI